MNVGGTVTQISVGYNFTCAILSGGNVRCWGNAYEGELGYGNTTSIGNFETPTSAGNVNVGGVISQIVAGGNSTFAVLNDGRLKDWGSNNSGQLGYGNTNNIGDYETPASVGYVEVATITHPSISFGGTLSPTVTYSCHLLNSQLLLQLIQQE